MVTVTTSGLLPAPPISTGLPIAQWAVAAGTSDVITAAYAIPNTSLPDGLILGVRALAANATTTPTFSPDGLPAYTITRNGGLPLQPGDITGALMELLLRFNLANTRWELLNPDTPAITPPWGIAGGTAQALTLTLPVTQFSLIDGMTIGLRTTLANTGAAPTLVINGGASKPIVKRAATALAAGDMALGAEYLLRYNATNANWVLLNPVVN